MVRIDSALVAPLKSARFWVSLTLIIAGAFTLQYLWRTARLSSGPTAWFVVASYTGRSGIPLGRSPFVAGGPFASRAECQQALSKTRPYLLLVSCERILKS